MKYFFIIAFTLCALFAMAQDDDAPSLTFNPEVGGNITSYTNSNSNVRLGYTAGLNLRLGNMIYLQPGAHFVKQAVSANIDTSSQFGSYQDISAYYIQTPVLLGVKILGLRIYGGIAPSFFMGGEVKNSTITRDDFKDAINAFRAGVGVDILALTLSSYVDWGVSDIYSRPSNVTYRSFTLSIGVRIF